jgi:large subunit ribosomal protein L40e
MYVPTPFTPPSSTIIATTTEAAMLAQTSPYPRAPLNYNVPVAIRCIFST